MRNLYEMADYREVIRKAMEGSIERGALSRLAEALKIERSHLSRILNGERELMPEQALRLAQYLRLSTHETDFLLLLVDRDRAGTHELKTHLSRKLSELRWNQQELQKRIDRSEPLSSQVEATYFSAWYFTAIHMLTALPGYSTTEAITKRLRLPLPLVEHVLSTLESFGLIEKSRGRWKLGKRSIHLEKRSPFVSAHHQHWRQRAIEDAQNPLHEGVHYTVVQSVSREDVEIIKKKIYALINEYTRISEPSASEELISFQCDFFKI